MIALNSELAGHYDYGLVALSIFIAILASYAALDLSARITSAQNRIRALWLAGGAAAMGIGIWSMHYVGMLAFRLPVPVLYDWPTVLLSLFAAILASATALLLVSRAKLGPLQLVFGALFMGAGIAGMHYIGMAAMRLQAECTYNSSVVAISVVLAILISAVALWLVFMFRKDPRSLTWRKALSAVAMGAAIPVMHYTGMAAAHFVPSPAVNGDLSHALSISSLGVTSIILVTFIVLALTLVTSQFDRRLAAQAHELELTRRAENKFRNLLETAPDAMIIVNRSGKIALVNSQAEKLFGYSREELIDREVEILMPERYRGRHHHDRSQFFAHPKTRPMGSGFDFCGIRKDGSEFPAEITLGPFHTEEGVLVSSAIRDVTERKQFERTLRDAKDAAEVASEAKSAFLAAMSHELRTPLNGIFGMTEIVLDSELTADQRESLGIVRSSAESLLTLITDILDYSNLDSDKAEMESRPFNLRDSLGESLRAFAHPAGQKGLNLAWDVHSDVPDRLVGDAGRIRQILNNLVGNAIKFTERGEVHVSVFQEPGPIGVIDLRLTVKDTGIGIAPEKQKKIFEPFSQADDYLTRRHGGTGLGLTICTRLVSKMNGKIWLESELGRGSSFHVSIPLALFAESTNASPHNSVFTDSL
jgi:two-component system, sensor histidine kinase and response regulator